MTRSSAAVGVVAVLAGTAIGLLRQPGAGALDTVWAEDGAIFLGEATRYGPVSALVTSYAGYYHAVPRLIAGAAALLPAGAAAAALAVAAALCVALLAVLVYAASASTLDSRLARVLVAAPVVLVPVAQDDVLNSPANLHWYGLYALFWVLLWRPRSTAGRVVAVAVVALVAASDILVLAYVPLAAYRAWRRERHVMVLAGVLGAGLAIQFLGLVTGASSRPLDPDPMRAAVGFVLRAVPATLVGERWLGSDVDARWLVLAAVAWLLVAAAVVVALRRITRPDWWLAGAAVLHAGALYMLPVLLSGVATPRYTVAPALLVTVALVALLQPAAGSLDRRPAAARRGRILPEVVPTTPPGPRNFAGIARSSAPIYALAALLAVVWAVNLRVDNSRADGPRWSNELPAARQQCATANGTAAVPIPPATEHWQVDLSCRYLTR